MATPIRVRGIGDNTYNASEFALVDFYFSITNGYMAHFQREMHIVDGLDANALIDIDVLHLEGWILDLLNESAELTYNLGLKVKLEVVARGDKIKRQVLSKAKTIVSSRLRRMVSFVGSKGKALDLSKRDMLFESFNEAFTMFVYLVDADTNVVMIENDTDVPVILSKHTRLGLI